MIEFCFGGIYNGRLWEKVSLSECTAVRIGSSTVAYSADIQCFGTVVFHSICFR